MKDTSKKTCTTVAQKIFTQCPDTFSDNIGDHIYGTGCESLKVQLYNAVMYRKSSEKGTRKRPTTEKDTDDEDEEQREQHKINLLKQDEYGCVDYSPDLPQGETAVTQEEKRKILLDMYSNMDQNDPKISRLMNETYATQRACINAKNRNLAVITTDWPYLKDAQCLISHFNHLVGKNVLNTWASFIETKLKPLRQYLKTYKYKDEKKKALVSDVIKQCKDACATTRSDVPKTLIIFRLLMLYFNENEDYFFKIIDIDVPDDTIASEAKCDNPVLLIRGDSLYDENLTCTVIFERSTTFFCKDALQAVIVLIASYFIFGFAYPPKVEKTLEYIQREIMKINPPSGSKRKNKRRKATTYDAAVFKLAKDVTHFQNQ